MNDCGRITELNSDPAVGKSISRLWLLFNGSRVSDEGSVHAALGHSGQGCGPHPRRPTFLVISHDQAFLPLVKSELGLDIPNDLLFCLWSLSGSAKPLRKPPYPDNVCLVFEV